MGPYPYFLLLLISFAFVPLFGIAALVFHLQGRFDANTYAFPIRKLCVLGLLNGTMK